MSSMSKQKKTTIIVVVIAVVLVIAALVCWAAFRPQALEGVKGITVTVNHSDGTTYEEEIDTTAQYLAEALEPYDLIHGEESEYGLFVTEIDGEIADGSDGKYWVYTVNGTDAEYGVDMQPVADGDAYVFYTIVF